VLGGGSRRVVFAFWACEVADLGIHQLGAWTSRPTAVKAAKSLTQVSDECRGERAIWLALHGGPPSNVPSAEANRLTHIHLYVVGIRCARVRFRTRRCHCQRPSWRWAWAIRTPALRGLNRVAVTPDTVEVYTKRWRAL
jgi:hypothetical protein